jgi:hypothetical protein
MALLPKSLIEKRCVDFSFFSLAPSGGKMLIETAVKNGARAPEERNQI